MVFQSDALYPNMTVRRNLAFGLKLRRTPAAEVRRRVAEAAEMLHVEHLLDRRPGSLSGGERRRVALGRAIVRRPQAMLLDEPLSNLDTPLRTRLRAELRRLHERLATTTIHVTHDQAEALTLGQRVAVIHAGRIQQTGPPEEVYRRPANRAVAAMIGAPPMNLLDGRIESRDGRPVFRCGRLTLPLPQERAGRIAVGDDRAITLGVRPEHVEVAAGSEGSPATVQAVETTGPESHLHLDAGDQPLVARVGPNACWRPGQPVELEIAPDGLHLFDAETGEALT
jgi:multiple sugar transport system ATP-binding protein